MATTGRTPPRFVPTLTTVVELPPELPTGTENMIDDLGFSSMPEQPPPVLWQPPPPVAAAPQATLEEPSQEHSQEHSQKPPLAQTAIQVSEEDAFRLEEQLLHRVLQRVDLSLEERLTDTVSAAVQRQLDVMLPRLRSEIETVLRSLVVEALAQELSENTGSTPAFRPSTFG
ncbi:hypothetical protein QTI66_01325 [Variovorax sp. J22R133]|uniref:hypothetical protein n=1 Tax=Variovorax brevis TaxID=3053503 RepID=UPI0025780D0B|nr:hypothetical protein [Variovorax sp. J22R133]MDM0110766.1 hypothetical protein [Variovorax sp. J22R133]